MADDALVTRARQLATDPREYVLQNAGFKLDEAATDSQRCADVASGGARQNRLRLPHVSGRPYVQPPAAARRRCAEKRVV
jgi:hypothetical protein